MNQIAAVVGAIVASAVTFIMFTALVAVLVSGVDWAGHYWSNLL